METNLDKFTNLFAHYLIRSDIGTILEAYENFLTQGRNRELRAREVFEGENHETVNPSFEDDAKPRTA